jgi:hypothetical protein
VTIPCELILTSFVNHHFQKPFRLRLKEARRTSRLTEETDPALVRCALGVVDGITENREAGVVRAPPDLSIPRALWRVCSDGLGCFFLCVVLRFRTRVVSVGARRKH